MLMNRVQVIWAGPLVQGGGLSTFYFDAAVGTAQQQVAAVAAFLGATEDRRQNGVSWQTAGDVGILESTTGALTGVIGTTSANGVGSVAGDAMPPSNQGLLRLLTNVVVGGRMLRGRLFLPGSMEADNTNGAPTALYRTDHEAAGAALVADANSTWLIWSRRHGVATAVTNVSTWTKWAVLRSRRD